MVFLFVLLLLVFNYNVAVFRRENNSGARWSVSVGATRRRERSIKNDNRAVEGVSTRLLFDVRIVLTAGHCCGSWRFFDGALAASDRPVTAKGGTARIPEQVLAIGARAESGTHQPTKHSTNLQIR